MSFKPHYYYKAFAVQKEKISLTGKLLVLSLLITFVLTFIINQFPTVTLLSPTGNSYDKLSSLKQQELKNTYEVFGFAPYWTLEKMGNVDFSVLTTLAYFDLPINSDGSIDENTPGYQKFNSDGATALFNKAHANGTRVVATVTQMDNATIKAFLDDPQAQKNAIKNITDVVVQRGIDGINIDYEYVGNPGKEYKDKFSSFVKELSEGMHKSLPGSNVTVSVYASAAKFPKLYDIGAISKATDGIFMMAYDFATSGSDNAIPTDPLYGYKEGKYWYDISTAVDDFLTQMPREKLILGLPWYGYDYPVSSPAVEAPKDTGYYAYYWYRGYKYRYFVPREQAHASTYALAKSDITPDETGWDDYGKVTWQAYKSSDGWRMIFLDDEKSLAIKYDFAKDKGLGGVGMWALGFDDGSTELWTLLENEFGKKLVASRI
jgi:spore germination protein YaaH